MRGRIFFYLTAEELRQGLGRLEEACAVKYVLTGMFDSPETTEYDSHAKVPNLGHSKSGCMITDLNFFIMPKDRKVEVQEVPQKKGGIQYLVSMFDGRNHDAIYWQTGGEWEDGVVITSCIQKVGVGNKKSTELYGLFKKYVLKDFEKIKIYSASPKSATLLDSGGRLTDNFKSMRSMELSR